MREIGGFCGGVAPELFHERPGLHRRERTRLRSAMKQRFSGSYTRILLPETDGDLGRFQEGRVTDSPLQGQGINERGTRPLRGEQRHPSGKASFANWEGGAGSRTRGCGASFSLNFAWN